MDADWEGRFPTNEVANEMAIDKFFVLCTAHPEKAKQYMLQILNAYPQMEAIPLLLRIIILLEWKA